MFGFVQQSLHTSWISPKQSLMPAVANVIIHESQFPESVRRDLLQSLRLRRINHKFHYDSHKQTQKWLALHEAHSPARLDPDCTKIYRQSFKAAAKNIQSATVHVIGLGCGGGQKDARLLKLLRDAGKKISYTPCDVSVPMVLVARRAALKFVPEKNCFPCACDLATARDLSGAFADSQSPIANRLITFFGMIPNFEPQIILPKLASLLRPKDLLLFSANLAPGRDYDAGLKKILPQYDNALTRDWLMTFLLDLGVEHGDGELRFTIDPHRNLKRIVANFHFTRAREIRVGSERFRFRAGEAIRLFFSYRYAPERAKSILAVHGIEVLNQWITKSEEEGVFLCRKSGGLSSTTP